MLNTLYGRALYGLCVAALLSGTAWTVAKGESGIARQPTGIGLVILAALQR